MGIGWSTHRQDDVSPEGNSGYDRHSAALAHALLLWLPCAQVDCPLYEGED
jgi:hypothetical protein